MKLNNKLKNPDALYQRFNEDFLNQKNNGNLIFRGQKNKIFLYTENLGFSEFCFFINLKTKKPKK